MNLIASLLGHEMMVSKISYIGPVTQSCFYNDKPFFIIIVDGCQIKIACDENKIEAARKQLIDVWSTPV